MIPPEVHFHEIKGILPEESRGPRPLLTADAALGANDARGRDAGLGAQIPHGGDAGVGSHASHGSDAGLGSPAAALGCPVQDRG